ncbi:hypothetical protein GCM10028819_05340 [Spirosoma humi]
MKQILFVLSEAILLIVLTASMIHAQVRVGLPLGTVDGSSSLDVRSGPYSTGSPYRGLLAPNVTTAQRAQIQNPAVGLIIFNNTNNQIEVNTGTTSTPIWMPGGINSNGSSGAWLLTGNTGTVDKLNSIGTLDNVPLSFKVFNQTAGRIDHILFNLGLGFFSINPNTTGTYNTALGSYSLRNNTNGVANTAAGAGALTNNTGGSRNTGLGHDALTANISGIENTGVGESALRNNTTGYSNTALGTDALNDATVGYDNTALGASALLRNIGGYSNTAAGALALRFNTSGNSNTASGNYALQFNSTGSFNTAAGFNAGPLQGNGVINNATAIGANAVVSASNTIVLGDAAITSLRSNVQTISSLSDKRIKEDIRANVPGLNFITKLNPVTYHINKNKEAKLLGYPVNVIKEDTILHSGFLAQEVESAAKAVDYNFEGVRQEEGGKYYTLGYTLFVIPLVQAVKDLNLEVESLKVKLQENTNDYKKLASQIEQLQKLLDVSISKNRVSISEK